MRAKLKNPVPRNFERYWTEQRKLVDWSSGVIGEHEHLSDHIEFIECYMNCVEVIRQCDLSGIRRYVIGALLLRSFDDFANSIYAAMTGNYRGSTMYIRSLLETDFLLDFLLDDPTRPKDWLEASESRLINRYSMREICRALDHRDGYKLKRRFERLAMLSKLAIHPHPKGFELNKDGTNMVRSGPFKQEDSLRQCIEEMARVSLGLSRRVEVISEELGDAVSIPISVMQLKRQMLHEKYFSK